MSAPPPQRGTSGDPLRYRWAVNVSRWEPSEEEFSWACSNLLLDSELTQVMKYKFEEDRKRALVSIVLQRTAGVKYWAWRRGVAGQGVVEATSAPLDAHGAKENGEHADESNESDEQNKHVGKATDTLHPTTIKNTTDDHDSKRVTDTDIDACIRALEDVRLGKTKGRKPYLVKDAGGARGVSAGAVPCAAIGPGVGSVTTSVRTSIANDVHNTDNFNYNVSHDGHYVVLASELYCICGCDVSSAGSLLGKCRRGPGGGSDASMEGLMQTLKSFEKQLTEKEWEAVYGKDAVGQAGSRSADGVAEVASRFAKYWSLKEAYVKAIGMGLGYDLGRVEFELVDVGEAGVSNVAFLSIDGVLSEDWCCYVQSLGGKSGLRDDGQHWVSVARGPVEDVVDAHGEFTGSFGARGMDRDVLNRLVFQDREPVFEEFRFDEVIQMGYGEKVYRAWADAFGGGDCNTSM